MKRFPILAAVLVSVLPACGSSSSSTPASPADRAASVAIKTFSFKPTPLQVSLGEAVAWRNHDDTMHTVTAGVPGAPSGFDSGHIAKDATFEHTFDEAGMFSYFCSIHDSMRGEIVAR